MNVSVQQIYCVCPCGNPGWGVSTTGEDHGVPLAGAILSQPGYKTYLQEQYCTIHQIAVDPPKAPNWHPWAGIPIWGWAHNTFYHNFHHCILLLSERVKILFFFLVSTCPLDINRFWISITIITISKRIYKNIIIRIYSNNIFAGMQHFQEKTKSFLFFPFIQYIITHLTIHSIVPKLLLYQFRRL